MIAARAVVLGRGVGALHNALFADETDLFTADTWRLCGNLGSLAHVTRARDDAANEVVGVRPTTTVLQGDF
jgi:hypothetical protein